jgi:tetratricopeptide (TPR) repeat protein
MDPAVATAPVSPPPDTTEQLSPSDIRDKATETRPFWLILAATAILGLLSAPLPSLWVGVAALVAVLIGRGRTLVKTGAGAPFWLAMTLYLAGALVGYAVTIRPDTANIRLFGILAGLGAFVLVALVAQNPRLAQRAAGIMLVVVLVATPLVFLLVTPFLPPERLPQGSANWFGFVEPIRQSILDQDDVLQRFRLRASGLGTLAAVGVGLALGPLIAGRRREQLLAAVAIGYFGVFLLAAGNRGAMLSAGLVTLLLVASRSRWLMAASVSLVIGILLVVTGTVRLGSSGPTDRVVGILSGPTTDPGSVQRRIEFWDNSLFLLGDFRFTGVGLGIRAVQETYETYFIPIEPRFSHSHNVFLQTYLEQGLLGLVGFVGLLLLGLRSAWRTLNAVRDPHIRSAAISAAGSGLALVVAGLTEIVALTALGMVLLFGSLGLLLASERLRDVQTERASAGQGNAAFRPAAIAVAFFVATLALIGPSPTTLAQSAPGSDDPINTRPDLLTQLTASFYLNQGAVEVNKVSIGIDRPRAERDQRLAAAEELLQKALTLDASNVGAYRNLAATHVVQSQRSAARRLLGQAEALAASDDHREAFQIGRLYRDNGDVVRAADLWTRVGAAPQLIAWGSSTVRRGQWRAALDINRAAIRAAPSERTPWQGLALSMDQVSGRRAVTITMERLSALYPGNPWPYLATGDLYASEGDLQTAREWYERGLVLAPNEPTLTSRLESQPRDLNSPP